MFSILNIIPFIILFLNTSDCARVDDAESEKGIHVSDYCPSTKDCPEGTHIMCMYYKPDRIMGSQCIDPKNVSITGDIAGKILDIVNAMRSKLAFGKEYGKSGVSLPRGYGMIRLRWDSELATFAQVFANQCLMRHDVCRATSRFHDPSQTVGLVQFTWPDWKPVAHNPPFKTTGLDMAKLKYAVVKAMYSWYNHKDSVTVSMIENYPDWSLNPVNTMGWHYLKMIYGSATHMGCGISAYTKYQFSDKTDAVFNSVQVVCNYSARPKKGESVYNKNPPTEVGYTIKCGCPEGYEEDIDCLCNEVPIIKPAGPNCDGLNCEPAVVVLPIFTVEDAPPHKLEDKAQARRADSGSDSEYLQFSELTNETRPFQPQDDNDIFKTFEIKEASPGSDSDNFKDSTTPGALSLRKNAPLPKTCNNTMPRLQNSIPQKSRLNNRIKQKAVAPKTNSITQQGRLNYRIKQEAPAQKTKRRLAERKDRYPPIEVRHRYFGKPPRSPRIQALQRGYNNVQRKPKPHIRPSIFSRVHKFELPETSRKDGTKLFTIRVTDYKRDVAPRKDFSYPRKLLNSYLDKKLHHEDYSMKTFRIINYYETSTLTTFASTSVPTRKRFHNFTNPQVQINRYMVTKFHYPEFNTSNEPLSKRVNIKNSNEESDKKLMALLDNLEQEVNHIDLNMNEKEIFDAKIRRIYGSVVGRDNDLLSSKITNDHDNFQNDNSYSNAPIQVLEDLNKNMHNEDRIYETEDKVKELHLKLRPGLYSRPIINNKNSQEYEEKIREPKHCKSEASSCTLGLTDHEDLNRPYFEEKSYKSGDKHYPEQIIPKDDNTEDNIDFNYIESRNIYKTELDSKKLKDDAFIGARRKNVRYKSQNADNNGPRYLRYRNGYRRKTGFKDKTGSSDPIGVNRRKQYQKKLDNLERKMHDVRGYRHRNEREKERAMRLMRPSSRDEVPIRPSVMKSPVGPIYMPERARFLHGF